MGSNTASNSAPGRPFVKGDPRINRAGRPKEFDALRVMFLQIFHEKAKNNGQPIVIDGHAVTVIEAVARSWVASKNPMLVKAAVEIAFGKVPDKVEMSGPDGKPIQFRGAVAPVGAEALLAALEGCDLIGSDDEDAADDGLYAADHVGEASPIPDTADT